MSELRYADAVKLYPDKWRPGDPLYEYPSNPAQYQDMIAIKEDDSIRDHAHCILCNDGFVTLFSSDAARWIPGKGWGWG